MIIHHYFRLFGGLCIRLLFLGLQTKHVIVIILAHALANCWSFKILFGLRTAPVEAWSLVKVEDTFDQIRRWVHLLVLSHNLLQNLAIASVFGLLLHRANDCLQSTDIFWCHRLLIARKGVFERTVKLATVFIWCRASKRLLFVIPLWSWPIGYQGGSQPWKQRASSRGSPCYFAYAFYIWVWSKHVLTVT